MPQLFSRKSTIVMRSVLAGAAVVIAVAIAVGYILTWSERAWSVGVEVAQPVPFSHALHAGGLGIDCRYCHTAVETSSFAGLPTAETCMTCHSQVWTAAAVLAPVRASYQTGEPLAWNRVHDLPDHSRFHHGAHVAAGVDCATCHGPVERMVQPEKAGSLSMRWCLDCHRDPLVSQRLPDGLAAGGTRPRDPSPIENAYGFRINRLTDCSICHY